MSGLSVVFLAPLARIEQRTRLAKFASTYQDIGFVTQHLGWDRSEADAAMPSTTANTPSRSLHSGGGHAEAGLGKHYVLWSLKLLIELVRNRRSVVHALGPEAALPAALAKLLGRVDVLVYDDADRLSLCHTFPKPLFTLVQMLERFVSRRAQLHIVPGLERYPDGIPAERSLLLKNTPSISVLNELGPSRRPSGSGLRLLATGWLGDTRGAVLMHSLATHYLTDARVEFVAAGRTTGEAADAFVSLPNVDYHGVVSNVRALQLCRDADLVLTLYDPAVVINRYAEPNKWGDCEALAVPFAVNSEVVTARPYLEGGMAVSAPYGDFDAWTELIESLLTGKSRLAGLKESAREQHEKYRTFEQQVEPVLRDMLLMPTGEA